MHLAKISKIVAFSLSVAWFTGCASDTSSTTEQPTPPPQPTTIKSPSSSATTTGMGTDSAMSSQEKMEANLRETTVFYFDFDQATVRSDSKAALAAHARFLAANPSVKAVLEGHADERGTREYNLALGERRAKAIQSFMAVQGVSRAQTETISYGEEKPAMMVSSDSAWSQNRRVELKY